jgi:hypothetical protein
MLNETTTFQSQAIDLDYFVNAIGKLSDYRSVLLSTTTEIS